MKRSEAIEYVKSGLKEYLIAQGINPDKQFSCISPEHNDKKPSMGVVDKTGTPRCHCLSCGATYDTWDVIGIVNGVSDFKEKERIAYQFFNITIDETKRRLSPEEQKATRLKQAMKEAVSVTRDALASNDETAKKCREYLANRKISNKTIEDFKIGVEYNNKIPSRLIGELYYKKDELLEVGLMRNTAYGDRDTFYNRVLVPICDIYGNPLGFGGRVFLDGNSQYKYLNTSDTPIFTKGNILFNYHQAKNFAKNGELVLVEGYFDVISAWEMGMKNVVASMGVGLQNRQIKLIKQLNCEIIVSLDNPLIDEAGKKAMLRMIPQLIKSGLTVSAYDTSLLGNKVKDFGDFLEQNISIERIKSTKIPAMHFLLKYQYFNNKKINVNSIYLVYNQLQKDGLINNTRDEMQYKDYIMNNTSLTEENIEDIIHPKEVIKTIEEPNQETKDNSLLNKIARAYFSNILQKEVAEYAKLHKDIVLERLIKANKLTISFLFKGVEEGNGIINNGNTFKYEEYIKSYIYNTSEYIDEATKYKEERQKERLKQMPNILDNVYGFDKSGNEVKIWLTEEQKEIVLKQYIASFDEENRNQVLEENKKAPFHTKLFIADTVDEYKKLWLGANVVDMQRWIIDKYSLGYMAAVPYSYCFRTVPNVDLTKLSEEYVIKQGNEYRYKCLLVYNNKDNSLNLTKENYINPTKILSKQKQKDNTRRQIKSKEERMKVNPKDIIQIPLKDNQYLTTRYGVYILNPDVTKNEAIYIDNKSYTKKDNIIELNLKSPNDMSVYKLIKPNDLSPSSREWYSKLTKLEFKEKYQSMYFELNSNINDLKQNNEPIIEEYVS